jgi:hypothetical protein
MTRSNTFLTTAGSFVVVLSALAIITAPVGVQADQQTKQFEQAYCFTASSADRWKACRWSPKSASPAMAPASAGAFYCPNPSADGFTCSSPQLFQRLTRGWPDPLKVSGDGAVVREAIPTTDPSKCPSTTKSWLESLVPVLFWLASLLSLHQWLFKQTSKPSSLSRAIASPLLELIAGSLAVEPPWLQALEAYSWLRSIPKLCSTNWRPFASPKQRHYFLLGLESGGLNGPAFFGTLNPSACSVVPNLSRRI